MAYDGTGVSDRLTAAFGPDVEIIIPPPRPAAIDLNEKREAHIMQIAENGRMAWQARTGDNNLALVEA